jgi:hypothetical protein
VGDRASGRERGGTERRPDTERGTVAPGALSFGEPVTISLTQPNGHPESVTISEPIHLSPGDLLAVTWRDAWFDFDGNSERDDYLVRTVGFLVKDGPKFLSLAQEVLPDGDGYRAVTHVPLVCIEHKQAL